MPYSAGSAPSVATLVNNRLPHDDLADLFAGDRSTFRLGVDGVEQALADEFGDEWPEIVEENYFEEEPRRLDEILAAEQETFDRIWYDRSMSLEQQLEDAGDYAEVERLRKVAGMGRARVVSTYGINDVGPYDKFEWGMLNGKLSALRWVSAASGTSSTPSRSCRDAEPPRFAPVWSDWWVIVVGIVGGVVLIWVVLVVALWFVKPDAIGLRDALRLLPDLLRLVKRLASDPRMPRGVRVRLVLLLAYLALPIDLIPDFIPVLGYADDAIVVAVVLRSVVRRAGQDAVRQHWPGTDDGYAALARLTGIDRAPDRPE
ncbi:MAG: hypothetical protein JWR11_5182 [Mycobacterium sp.]|nr:hypothetical protein [Mycobacterium sp.]